MKKRNIFKLIAIILIVLGLFSIALSFVSDDNNDMQVPHDNVETGPENSYMEEKTTLTTAEVYNMGLSLYGGDNIKIEVEEEEDRFIIKRIFLETDAFEIYYVDKETGYVYTDEFTTDSIPTG